jgi:hypothetical protein
VLTRPPEKDELAMLDAFAAEQRARSRRELDAAKLAGRPQGEEGRSADGSDPRRRAGRLDGRARAVMNLDEAVAKN